MKMRAERVQSLHPLHTVQLLKGLIHRPLNTQLVTERLWLETEREKDRIERECGWYYWGVNRG